MDCNLDEVSGQMMLPRPILVPSAPKSHTTSAGISRSRLASCLRPLFGRRSSSDCPTPRVACPRRDSDGRCRGSLPSRCAVRCLEPKEYRPMTVRWKPLVFLSGVFLIVGLIGVVAITLTLVPALVARHSEAGARGPRGRAIRKRRDLFQASPSARAPRTRRFTRNSPALYRDWAQARAGRQDGRRCAPNGSIT